MLHPISLAGLGINNPSLSQGPVGVLRNPTAQPHPRFDSTHLGLCRSLRTVSGLRGTFRTMEKILLPRPKPSRGFHI